MKGLYKKLKKWVLGSKSKGGGSKRYGRVIERSPYENIYYCCVQKTASQWLRAIFNDPLVHAYTGMRIEPYRELGLKQAGVLEVFPTNSIVTHLYVDYPTFQRLPKPDNYKVFFITRDPRDAVVSWFYSAKYSHAMMSVIPEMRAHLVQVSKDDGMKYIIDKLCEFGYFDAQRSWHASGEKVYRYEMIARDHRAFLGELFEYLEIRIPEGKFSRLCDDVSFSKKAGREQGEENKMAHYRKGVEGDWKNHFTPEIQEYFDQKVGPLVEELGY